MPYQMNADLPASVQNHLPEHAQDIYRQAFNSAWLQDGDLELKRREEVAHRVAWSAVKKRYQKIGESWVLRE
jgi:cation transport regulator